MMLKSQKLCKLHHLISLQEKGLLVELNRTQQSVDALKSQINDLASHSHSSEKKIIDSTVNVNDLILIKSFSNRVSTAIDQMTSKLQKNEVKYSQMIDKVTESRRLIKSVERLTEKYKLAEKHAKQRKIQQQLEENIYNTSNHRTSSK